MAKRVQLMSTAYGAPWGGIQGTGVTATGIDLRAHPKQYVVAVDPRVIPLGSKLKIPHNPFGDPNIVFTAADTGGAIKGNRLDFYDWRGRKAQMDWGTRSIEAQIVGHGAPHDTQRAGGGTPGTPATPGTYDPGQASSDLTQSSGADLATLVQQMMQPQRAQGVSSAGLPDPSFSARSALRMPAAYQAIASSGGPAPRPDMSSVIQSILPALQGGAMPADSRPTGRPGTPGTAATGGAGAPGRPVKGFHPGSPIPGEAPHSSTHDTLGLTGYPAYDYMAPAGTPVAAPVSGKVLRFGHDHDPNKPPPMGVHGPFGRSVYIQGDNGKIYYLTHMGSRNVKIGQRVTQGTQIGTVGNYAKWGGADHVHMGVHG